MKLRLLSPSPEGSTPSFFEIPEGKLSLSIGRTPNNDLAIDETSVSASHAKITQLETGHYELSDLNSSNGTFVNENKITKTEINDGDIIRIATIRFFFEESEKPPADSTSPLPTSNSLTNENANDSDDELKSLKHQLWKKDSTIADLGNDLNSEKATVTQLSSDLSTAQASNETLSKELSDTNKSLKSLKKSQTDLQKKFESEQATSSDLSSKLSDSENSNKELTQTLKEANASIKSLNLSNSDLQKKLESEQKTVGDLSSNLSNSENSNKELSQTLSEANDSIESLNLSHSDLQNRFKTEQATSSDLSTQLSDAQKSNQSLTENLSTANITIESLELTQSELRAELARLDISVLETLETAKSVQNNLSSDWYRWIGESNSEVSSTAIAAASDSHKGVEALSSILSDLESSRSSMRDELDKIESIWDKSGPEVEKVLADNCADLEAKIENLSNQIDSLEATKEELNEDLLELRRGIDEQIRKAQTVNRDGVRCEIPEKNAKMVVATDTEETIFRKIVERLDTINELSSQYQGKLTHRKISRSLDSLRDDFLVLLAEHSVTPFTFDKGTMLTTINSGEVEIVHSKFDRITGPVTVVRTAHPGISLKDDTQEIVLRKAKVVVVTA